LESNKQNILYGILGGVAVVLIGLMIYFNSDGLDKYHWRQTYDTDEKQPYDTYIIYNLIKNSTEPEDFINSKSSFKHFQWDSTEVLNYIFIGEQAYYSEDDRKTLLGFVKNGNNVFISQEYMDNLLYDQAMGRDSSNLYLEDEYDNQFTGCIGMEDCYTFKFNDGLSDTAKTYWPYFYGLPHNDSIEYLGRVDGKEVNFYRTKHGKGYFYFHSNPLLLTNYYLTDSINWNYANKLFAFLPGDKYYWDKHAYLNISELGDEAFQNPLKHILSNKSFQWAWYVMVALILLFLLLNSKRKQRNIPFMEPNENSTIEFTETIGQLYFKEQNHYKIIQLMMKMFLFQLYSRYKIPVHKHQDDQTVLRLAQKTGVDEQSFRHILDKYNFYTSNNFAKSEDLIYLYRQINNYNNSCK